MMGIEFTGEVPFREVYVHGLIRDAEGQKMSKSKGNVIDPLDVVDGIGLPELLAKRTTGLMQPQRAAAIDKATRKAFPQGIAAHGTDALRFTFAQLATQSADLRFDLERVDSNRKFCNKLWNAARFVLMTLGEQRDAGEAAAAAPHAGAEPNLTDRWIRSRFGRMLHDVEGALRDYRLDFAAGALYEFAWHEFCDWYLELSKPLLQGESASAADAARRNLALVLESLMRALHPLMPFITEEIWQRVAPAARVTGPSLMVANWPDAAAFPLDPAAEADIAWIQGFVLGLRQIRGEMDISPGRALPVLLEDAAPADRARLAQHGALLTRLAALESVRVLAAGEVVPPAAIALVGAMKLLVPMAGLIDPQAEAVRLSRRIEKTRAEVAKARAKLSNPNFVDHAPAEVVAQERTRIEEFDRSLQSLVAQLGRVAQLGGGP
jgi:valyl-tRNA synthetase